MRASKKQRYIFLITSLIIGYGEVLAQSTLYKIGLEAQTQPIPKTNIRQVVTAVLTNVSDSDLVVYRSNPLHDFELLVTDKQGNEVPMTALGKSRSEGQNQVFTHVARVTLKPQESTRTPINLHDYYELQPGEYVIQVRRHVAHTTPPRKAGSADGIVPSNAASASEPSASASISIIEP